MTINEKITLVKAFIGDNPDATDSVISAYLTVAKSSILNRLNAQITECSEVPLKYEMIQCRLAERYFNRRGAEGEKSHNENGISRTYGSVNDEDLLSEITPIARIM